MFKTLLATIFAIFFWVTGSPANAASLPPAFASPLNTSEAIIVIRTGQRKLFFYGSSGKLETFSIAVGRDGRNWQGVTYITRVVLKPRWAPPPIIRKDNPSLPDVMEPGPNNPLGAAVIVLGDGTYGIHGTNNDASIGQAVSYGCIRMHNEDILHVVDGAAIGTPVTVLP